MSAPLLASASAQAASTGAGAVSQSARSVTRVRVQSPQALHYVLGQTVAVATKATRTGADMQNVHDQSLVVSKWFIHGERVFHIMPVRGRREALNIEICQEVGAITSLARPYLRSSKRLHSEANPHAIDSIHCCDHERQLD